MFKPGLKNIWQKIKKKLFNMSPLEIFILLTVITSTVFVVKYFGIKEEWRTIVVEVTGRYWWETNNPYLYRSPYWIADKIKVGQTEKDTGGNVIAELIDFENFEKDDEESDLFLTLKVKTIHNKKTTEYLFNGNDIYIGSKIKLKLDNVFIVGQVVDDNVPAQGYPTKTFQVTIRARNLEHWQYSQLLPNDKIIDRAKEEAIGEIIDVKIKEPTATLLTYDNIEKNLIAIMADLKDVLITINLKSTQRDGKWFFANHQNLKIGNEFNILTPKINLYDTQIIDIKEI